MSAPEIIYGDALDLVLGFDREIDLLVSDPPYAFGGAGAEHELSATVAVVLREAAVRLRRGSWAVIFAASSWRSTAYMVDTSQRRGWPVKPSPPGAPGCGRGTLAGAPGVA